MREVILKFSLKKHENPLKKFKILSSKINKNSITTLLKCSPNLIQQEKNDFILNISCKIVLEPFIRVYVTERPRFWYSVLSSLFEKKLATHSRYRLYIQRFFRF